MTLNEIVPIVSAATAFVAVVVGPFVAYRASIRQADVAYGTANLQARANVLSKSRQEWINSLRSEIACFMSSMNHTLPTTFLGASANAAMLDLMRDIRLHHAKVQLLINPTEADHLALVETMGEMVRKMSELDLSFNTLSMQLTTQAQKILKREWEVVKRFE